MFYQTIGFDMGLGCYRWSVQQRSGRRINPHRPARTGHYRSGDAYSTANLDGDAPTHRYAHLDLNPAANGNGHQYPHPHAHPNPLAPADD